MWFLNFDLLLCRFKLSFYFTTIPPVWAKTIILCFYLDNSFSLQKFIKFWHFFIFQTKKNNDIYHIANPLKGTDVNRECKAENVWTLKKKATVTSFLNIFSRLFKTCLKFYFKLHFSPLRPINVETQYFRSLFYFLWFTFVTKKCTSYIFLT